MNILPRSDELVRLIEPGHTYLVGEGLLEREAPSLSRVLEKAGYATDYSAVEPEYLAFRARVGTFVHEKIAQFWDGLDPFNMGDDGVDPFLKLHAKPHIDAFLAWQNSHSVEPLVWEVPGYNPDWLYACTEDLVCLLDGDLWVIDIKTTYKVSDVVALQTAGQSLVYNEDLVTMRRGALHLPKKGKAKLVEFVNHVRDYTTLQAITTAHNNRKLYV